MPDGDVTFQGVEGLLIENLGDKTQVLVHHNLISIANGDAGRLLPSVLEGVQAVVGKFCDFLPRCPHAKNTALFTGCLLAMVVKRELRGLIQSCHDAQS